MSKSKLSVAIVSGLLLSSAVFFQNCSSGPQASEVIESGTSNRLESGNGGGYGGKVTYSRTTSGENCPDGSNKEATVEVRNDGKVFLTRNNCQNLDAQEIALADVHLMAHNDKNIIFQNAVFDLASKTDGLTALLCRGEAVDSAANEKRVVDATIRHQIVDGIDQYFGRAILGIYDLANNLKKTYDMGEVPLASPTMPNPDIELYISKTVARGEGFNLQVRRADHIGFLQYNGSLPKPGGVPTAGSGSTSASSELYTIKKLNCYEQ